MVLLVAGGPEPAGAHLEDVVLNDLLGETLKSIYELPNHYEEIAVALKRAASTRWEGGGQTASRTTAGRPSWRK